MNVLHAAESVAYVPQAILDLGWWAVYLFLLGVVFLEAQATYWIGRAAVAGGLKSRWHRRFEGPTMERAHRFIERWGAVAVPLSFLTVGLRSAVQASAGFTRMSVPRYTLAMIPGCLAWAGIYTGLGAAATTLFRTFTWWFVGVIAVGLAVAVVATLIRRRTSGD